MTDRLSAAQAAARLDVRVETLYAYVSRGLLSRSRDDGRSSFDPLEVERFAATRTRHPRPPAGQEGRPLLVIDTDVASVDDGELFYRGVPVRDLVARSFDEVVDWLVAGEWHELVAPAGDPVPTLGMSPLGALTVAVVQLGERDPIRADLDAGAASQAIRRLIADAASSIDVLPSDPRQRAAVDVARIALIDHDLAVSTLAVRAAASARASLHSCLVAGLGAFAAPLHGLAGRAAYRLLGRLRDGVEPARALAASSVHEGRGVPGFGVLFHGGADPRYDLVLDAVRGAPGSAPAVARTERLVEVVADRLGMPPNVDLALATLAHAFDLGEDAGPAIFALGRMAGWSLHALDEYRQAPLRLRPIGRYVGA